METIRGKIYKIFPKEQKTEKFAVRNLVIQVDESNKYGDFTEHFLIQAANKKIALLDNMEEGVNVEATIALSGRKYNKKDSNGNKTSEEGFFTTLSLIAIKGANSGMTNSGNAIMADDIPSPSVGAGGAITNDGFDQADGKDDLPF